MGILRKAFLARKEWWALVPDQEVFAAGGNTKGDVLNLAARHADGKWIMVYLAAKATFSIHLDRLAPAGPATAAWIDPRTGQASPAGSFAPKGDREFTTPQGWEDALLVLDSSGQ